jgi:hypothetical protein
MAITEAEWDRCTNPNPMLHFLLVRRQATARKLRLFAVACLGRVGELLGDQAGQRIVRLAEAMDGCSDKKDPFGPGFRSLSSLGGTRSAGSKSL